MNPSLQEMERMKLASGKTCGQWADEALESGDHVGSREEIILYCFKQMAAIADSAKQRPRTTQEQIDSIEGGLGSL